MKKKHEERESRARTIKATAASRAAANARTRRAPDWQDAEAVMEQFRFHTTESCSWRANKGGGAPTRTGTASCIKCQTAILRPRAGCSSATTCFRGTHRFGLQVIHVYKHLRYKHAGWRRRTLLSIGAGWRRPAQASPISISRLAAGRASIGF